MLTKTDAERISQGINAIRPDWPIASLMKFLGSKCQHLPTRDVFIQLAWVAFDEATRTPARILEDGPWKSAVLGSASKPYRTITDDDCAICFVPHSRHMRDHEFEPQHARAKGEPMTDEQRAAMQPTTTEARMK